jgi:hypothetical protein
MMSKISLVLEKIKAGININSPTAGKSEGCRLAWPTLDRRGLYTRESQNESRRPAASRGLLPLY